MNKIVFFSAFLISFTVFGQDCNCEENFLWMKKTFEENDAGFQYVLDKKGNTEYEKHNQKFLEKAKTTTKVSDCGDLLYDWLLFFRRGHIALNVLEEKTTGSSTNPVIDNSGWESVTLSDDGIKELSNLPQNGFEGVWKSPPYTLGIVKDKEGYVGFIIDAPGTSWKKKHIKLRLHPNADQTTFSGNYYLRNYSKQELTNVKMIGKNHLQLDQFSFERVNPKEEDSKSIKNYFELMKSPKPMMLQYSKNTLVLRIPSFDDSNKKTIDSLLNANHKKIISTPNLVIDIRNNGGGSDRSYSGIIPYLYTNPIRIVGVEMLSTPLNNQRMEGFLKSPNYTEEEKKEVTESLKKLNENLGRFVNLDGQKVSIQTMDKVYANPKNVGILINQGDGSTTEQFLLAAKQSTKTKLFGKTTFGSLDISNMNFVKSPSGKFELGYCLSKSYRIPDMAIDGKGIMPDYYMDDTIQGYEWIDFVERTFQNKD